MVTDDFKCCLILIVIGLYFTPNKLNAAKVKDKVSQNCQFSSRNNNTTINNYSDKRIKRYAEEFKNEEMSLKKLFRKTKCIPDVTLQRCNTKFEDDPRWIWRRVTEYYIPSIVVRKCDPSNLTYIWTLYDNKTGKYIGHFPGFKDKTIFIVKYYGLGTGNYKLKLTVSEIAVGKRSGSASAYCLVRIKPEDPIPIIRGGSRRTVPSGQEFTMVGRDSINMDTAPGKIAILNFEWFCTKGPKPLCNNEIIDEINDIIISANEAADGRNFEFLLKVSTDDSKWFSTTQIVNVKKNAHLVYIKCLKNCGLKVNYRSVMYLEAYCDDCPKDNYEWSMTPGKNNQKATINFETETSYGKNSPKLVVKEGVLVPGDIYTFNVAYDGGNSESSANVKVALLPTKGNCTITPTEGKSLTTLFHINCREFKDADPLTYHIYQRDSEIGGQGVLLAANEDGQFKLYLSAAKSGTVELLIRVGNTDGLYVELKLTPSVTSVISELPVEQQIKKLLDEYEGKNAQHESVQSLIAKGDTEGAIQKINILTAEARQVSNSAEGYKVFKKKWKTKITQNLEQLPWESQDALRQVTATIKNLNWADKDIIERDFAKTATRLCRNAAEKQINNVMESPNREIMTEDAVELSQDLLWCAETNMKSNSPDLKREEVYFNITTAYPLLTFAVIPENYPNYDDVDLEYAQKLRDYQEITANAMQTFTLTGIGIAETLAPGEPVKQIDKYTNILQATKDKARLLPSKSLGGFNSLVHASESLAKWKSDPAVGVVTAFAENPFWWDIDAANFSARVLNVDCFVNSRKLVNLKKPMELLFDVKKIDPNLINASVSVPVDLNKWTAETLDLSMTVHRVDVNKGAALRIEFFGLEENDKIQVVLTYNRRPNYEDFNKAVLLSPGKTMLMSLFPKKMLNFGDAWFYVAVLPDKSMLKVSDQDYFTYNYNVSFISSFCVYRKKPSEKWSSVGCRTGKKTTLTKLHCLCIHRSPYSGIYLNAPNKIDSLLPVHFVLRMKSSYVIFICVCIVFGIYCIALIYVTKTRSVKSSKKIFFLGDNIQHERYAYLVTVKTGNMYSAGTTSNIGMKVFGKKFNSCAHVMNYPDPDKKLLQRGNEDWFLLTTEKHLGKIKKIYLWHDSIGLRPSWNCEWVLIIDLQDSKEWFFDVQTWFSVLKEEIRHLSVKPSIRKPVSSWRNNWTRTFLKSIQQEHSWNICKSNKENGLSKIHRITIMLSVILITYFLALIMYGTPGMRLYDGLGYGHYGVYSMTILVTFFSSLLSFLLNLTFIVLFKTFHHRHNTEATYSAFLICLPWILLCTTVVVLLTFLVVFGFWVAHVTSLLWVSSTIGALIQTVLLLENVYILIKVTIWNRKSTASIATPSLNKLQIIEDTETQRYNFFSKFGYSLLRPYFASKYRPLTREEWKIKKEQEITRLKIAELLQDLIMFSIYIVLLYVVTLANKDPLNIYSNNEMKYLIYGEHTRTTLFKEIENVDGFYEYINETLIPNIHSSNWYGIFEMAEPGLMADFNIKILGVARFRQLRVCNKCCKMATQVIGLNTTCLPEFSSWYSDVGEYMEYWKSKIYSAVPRLIGAWKYQNDAMSSIGELAVYSGGGYSAPLGRTLFNSYYNLKYYQDTQWIDERSRVIHVEFLTYNANYNIFHAVKLLFERSASGLLIKSHSICTTRLLFVKMEVEIMTFTSFVAFIIIIFIMVFKNVYIARKNWRIYLRELWNIVDVMIILMSFACIGMYIHRDYLVGDFLHQLEVNQHNVFISYFDLVYMEQALTVLASLLICVATIRLWKLLRFGVIFRIMEKTLLLSALPLTAVAISHLIIILMYSFSGYILFGAQSQDFRHLTATLTTLILFSLNLHQKFDYDFLEESYGGYIYYTTYMLISMTIFTLYIAVIVLSYNESGNYYSNLKQYYTVQKYVDDESKYLKEFIQRRVKNTRLAGGADDLNNAIQKKVTPKSDEHRYADSVVVPTYKIFVMSLVARCVVLKSLRGSKGKRPFSNADANLMRKAVFHLISNQEIPETNSIAFTSFDDGKKMKLVSNNRILKMEYVVNCILEAGTAKNSKIDQFDDISESLIMQNGTHTQLDYFEDVLKSILNVIDNIRITVPQNLIIGEKETVL